jgi:ring-1,2-phenylacetyl-CoA epoxidase subunit PaaE
MSLSIRLIFNQFEAQVFLCICTRYLCASIEFLTMQFYSLIIKSKKHETSDTVTLEFDVPAELHDTFLKYKQGQYITVKTAINGQELRRSYSMSSSPLEGRLAVTVKKVSGGAVSSWLHDTVKVGNALDVATPEGRFFVTLDADKRRTYYLFAAGSGITPLMSIAKATLEQEPMSTIFMLYGSRNEEQIIFREELDAMSERYAGQFFVEYVLSQPKKEGSGGLFGLFKKNSSNWSGKTGRVDAKSAERYLEENMPHGPETDCIYFICGPGNMAEAVETTIIGRGIEKKQIHTERFVNANHTPGAAPAPANADGGARLIVHLKGERIETVVPKGETILDTLVREKYDVPYSCTAGACSTCMAKVTSGKVAMDACYALDDDEVKAGYCLTCQARPETGEVEIVY